MGFFESLAKKIDREPPQDEIQAQMEAHPEWGKNERLIGATLAAMVAAAVGLGAFFVVEKPQRPPPVLMVNEDLSFERYMPQRIPAVSSPALAAWTLEVVKKAYTFDFLHSDEQLGELRPYFTDDGWEQFARAVLASDLYKQVKSQKLSVSITPTQEPEQYGMLTWKKNVAWQYKIPAVLNFAGDTPTKPLNVMITVTFMMTPTTENPKGLGVTQFITEIRSR